MTFTVSNYLIQRLEEIGLQHLFGIPGDYVLDFFSKLEKSSVKLINTCNELNAGYAADAYARIHGVSAVAVTYGVGGFSLFNAVVGANAERIPMIVISGAPGQKQKESNVLLHHTIGDVDLQYKIFEKVTAKSVQITSHEAAPEKIDDAIVNCLQKKWPVYIEISHDIMNEECSRPKGSLLEKVRNRSNARNLEKAVSHAVRLLEKAKKPLIFTGIESQRIGCVETLKNLIDHSGYLFASSLLAKSVIPEDHPHFVGVYSGALVRDEIKDVVEESDVVLALGVLMTDINLGSLGSHSAALPFHQMVIANSDKVSIENTVYEEVFLCHFMEKLMEKMPVLKKRRSFQKLSEVIQGEYIAEDKKIINARFYERLNRYLEKNQMLIVDTGDTILGASDLILPEDTIFIDQAYYLSIGYALPATLGASLAKESSRAITIIGDGAFQMTAQELSTIIRYKKNPVIFVINNDGYTIERVLHEGSFNDIQMWNYSELPEVFGGGWGMKVRTELELEEALKKAKERESEPCLIEIVLDKMDCSKNLQRLGELKKKVSI